MDKQEIRKKILDEEFSKHLNTYKKLIDAWSDCADELERHCRGLEYMRETWMFDYKGIVDADTICGVISVIDGEIKRYRTILRFFNDGDVAKWDEVQVLANVVYDEESRYDDDNYKL